MHDSTALPGTYFIVYIILVALTFLTCAVSFLHESPAWHTVVGMAIATIKSALVALFFMHLLYSGRVTWLVMVAALLWLALLLGLTLSDFLTRHWLSY